MKGAWVTLATNDSYSLGALVLAHSLRQVGTTQELAVLVTPGVTSSMRTRLSEVFNLVKEVNVLDSRDQSNLRLLRRPELGITFTKLHCWQLTQYEKCVFLDADTLVLQNCDELFDREEFSAAPDVGWPDCFNSGVFVYRPSGETFDKLIQFALEKGSFDGGDQGLLNLYFSDWAHKDISKHLPFIYNVCSTAFYSYLPAFKQFGKDVKILHFIGNAKPWLQYFDTETRTVRPSGGLSHLSHILQKWWDIFCHMVHPNLLPDMSASYPDTVSESTPPQSFQTPYTKPDSPTRHSCEPQNVWDPWEEYDRNQQNLPSVSTQPFESHNTSAFSLSANKPSVPIHSVPSSPTFHEYHDTQIEQSSNLDNSRLFEYYNVDVNNSEAYLELPQNEQSSHECSHHEDLLLNDNHEENSLPTVTTVISNEFSETPPHLESPRENCDISSSSMRYVLSPSDDFSNQALPDPLTIVPVDPPCSSENFPKTLSPKSLEECETPASITNGATERQNETQESGLAGAFSKLILGQQRTPEQEALESNLRRQNWEQGNIDYLGRDSFDNIWTKICETLAKAPQKVITAEDSPATLDSVADTQQQVEKEPQPSQEIVTAPESSKQDDKTGETKESCVAPPPTEEIQSTPREGAVCSLPISEQRSEVSSEVTNIASSEPSSVSPTESQSEAIAPVIPIDKDPNSILSSTVQSTNVQVAKEKEVATSTQTELAATESTESTKGVPEIAPVSSAPLPENVSQQSQIAGKIDEALPIIPQSPTSGEANQVIPESVKPSEPSESVCVPAKEESAPTDTISSVPQCLDTMQTPIAAEKQNLADVPVTENQSSPNAKDSCSITSQTSAQTQSSQVETPTPCVPIPISETPSNDQSSGQSDISPREEIPPPEGISTSEVIPVSSKLLSESPISSPMQTTPPAQVPAPVETSTQSQPPQEVPSATVASSCKEQCAVPEASQVADPVKISPSPIKSTETSVKLESTSVEETTTKESQTPKTQDAAPSSQVASETTQAASSPAAKVEVCPIAPPPRKSGGTKKQGKSKK